MRYPSFGLILDGAPTAFTYGHHPSNARVVISRGLIELLDPAELEAVVAHELGHACHWDMALMTLANLVPLLLYYLYRVSLEWGGKDNDKGGWVAVAVGAGAYVLYIISEYMVLWFSRTREYYADRFAGQMTGNPNALARALVKIAYGLAGPAGKQEVPEDEQIIKTKKEERKARAEHQLGALNALNIFDQNAALGLVMSSAVGKDADKAVNVEQLKSAMQWDLWNPWAKWYEINSTHPLVAKRLLYLGDQAAHQNQEPLVVFDRRKPQSYWGDFIMDVFMMMLPWLFFLAGVGAAVATWNLAWLAVGVGLAGVGSLLKTDFVYRWDHFPHLSVAALLHKVRVSAVRPVPTTLTGTIIGKGVPGLVWSEDFVLRDRTGLIFLNYRQPFGLWNFLFGLFKAERYQRKEVRVSGWFRRSPVPFLEINRLEVIDGSEKPRRCYSWHFRVLLGWVLIVAGVAAAAFGVGR